ncbi:MAG: preprotein translocase subunit YajC [Thermomonas sp.]|nr:preprotein translocase subunit YajC [Thermomonas sp.]
MIARRWKRRRSTAMLDKLSRGDGVITNGGIAGTVDEIGENFVTVEIAAGVRVRLRRAPSRMSQRSGLKAAGSYPRFSEAPALRRRARVCNVECARWKYVVILLVLALSVLYAVPNVFPSEPAVQVTANRGASVDAALQQRVEPR